MPEALDTEQNFRYGFISENIQIDGQQMFRIIFLQPMVSFCLLIYIHRFQPSPFIYLREQKYFVRKF